MELCIPNVTQFSTTLNAEEIIRGSQLTFCENDKDETAFTAYLIVAAYNRLGRQAIEKYVKRTELKRLPPDVLISAAKRLTTEIYDNDFGIVPTSEAKRLGIKPPPWPEPFVAIAPLPLVLEMGIVPMPSLQLGKSRPGAYVERGLVLMTRYMLYEFVKSLYFTVVEKRVEPLAKDLVAMYNLPLVEPERLGLRRIVVKMRSVEGQKTSTTLHGDPPCMVAILEALKRGENLPHTARFAITTYLLKRGWDVEQIVDLFRNAPDFNEKITRYQVQHIAGRAGGRKEYAVPSCKTMREWGLCITNCGIKNPLEYGRK